MRKESAFASTGLGPELMVRIVPILTARILPFYILRVKTRALVVKGVAMKHSFLPILAVLLCGLAVIPAAIAGDAGSLPATSNDYKILAPITHGDLTIFPVVSAKSHDTSDFITLDEGIRSGEVVVTEVGNLHSTMRRRPPYQTRPYQGAEVNRLVLVNNSKHPLILLAGEVVTGGKQDRVVGKDRIVPAESDPVDLSVFCVEHGRWTETSTKFDTHASVM